MYYNWEEIFKTTSSEDLYRIYQGHALKPKEAIPFAKKELERRGFDFNDMDNNKKRWQLINALEDQTLDNISNHTSVYISFKYFLLILMVMLLFSYLVDMEENSPYTWENLIFPVTLSIILVLINNLHFKYQYNKRKKIQDKIDRLKKELHCDGVEEPEKLFQDKDVFRQDVKLKKKELHPLSRIMDIMMLVMLIIFIFVKLYKHIKGI